MPTAAWGVPYMSINLYITMVNGDMNAIYETDSKEAARLAAAMEIVPRSVRLLEWIHGKVHYADNPMTVQVTLKTCEAELATLKDFYRAFLDTKPSPRNRGALMTEAQTLIDRAGECIAHVRLQIDIVEKRAIRRGDQPLIEKFAQCHAALQAGAAAFLEKDSAPA